MHDFYDFCYAHAIYYYCSCIHKSVVCLSVGTNVSVTVMYRAFFLTKNTQFRKFKYSTIRPHPLPLLLLLLLHSYLYEVSVYVCEATSLFFYLLHWHYYYQIIIIVGTCMRREGNWWIEGEGNESKIKTLSLRIIHKFETTLWNFHLKRHSITASWDACIFMYVDVFIQYFGSIRFNVRMHIYEKNIIRH